MKKLTFKGGLHPLEKKELTENLPIERVLPFTNVVVIPLTQGGSPNQCLVKVGDSVAKGQKIADNEVVFAAPVHASVAGTVKKIEHRLVTGNIEAACVTIEADGSDRTDYMPPLDPFTCPKGEALARIRNAGIVGMGGAAFPAHVKLNPPADKKIDCILANGAECEPYLTIDHRTMLENADAIIDGLAIVMKLTNAPKGIVVVEDNKTNVVPVLQTAIEKSGYKDITVQLVKTKYPQGGERSVISAVMNREIPAGKLPFDAGCLVHNVGTLAAISAAFREGKPLIERGFTISGGACENPKNLIVPIGTLIGDLIPSVVSLRPGVKKIIAGGPMMGIAMMTANFPVQKNTSGVLFLTEKETSLVNEDPCLGCGRCIDVCSCMLNPVSIVRSLKFDDLEGAKYYGLMECVECGTCAYICPSHIKLVQRFRIGKSLVRDEMQRQAAKEKAKEQAAAEKKAAEEKGEK